MKTPSKNKTIVIAPTILVSTFEEFAKRRALFSGFLPYVQIDIMDGKFVPTKSFSNIERINELDDSLKYDLHLMVADPIAEMTKWKQIRNVFRAIFPIESVPDPTEAIKFARDAGWELGLVLNPDTKLDAVIPYLSQIDVLMFMTAYPGYNGAKFEPKVIEKIKEFAALPNHPPCAVDGGVNKTNIKELADAGIEIFNVGSALINTDDVKRTYSELLQSF